MLTPEQITEFIKTLRNPRWIRPDKKGAILFDGTFRGGLLEFYASPIDAMDYGRKVYNDALLGKYGFIKEVETTEPMFPGFDP